jgi:hypothetical protein
MNRPHVLILLSGLGLAAYFTIFVASVHGAEPATVDFKRDILPLLGSQCLECHNREDREGGLWFAGPKDLVRLNDSGVAAIVSGKSADSELIRRITATGDERMPPDGDRLKASEITKLKLWIDAGAPWPEEFIEKHTHWAYVPPQRKPLPDIRNTDWVKNGIDYFVLERLELAGLKPSPPADRARLIRRVSLDLIGLPPTPAEVDAFLNDTRPGAYERLLDRLLASPAYGEHWARQWLDLARYADSNGFQADQFRSMWAWRDWVIRSMNDDMPFDQFSIEQLAGDLLPNATVEQRTATGFQRCTTCNVEAGVDPEENRVNQIVDRVNTTGTVWLGTTLECAQCHNHKYDPFSQQDYYQIFSFFNNTPLEVKLSSGVTFDFFGPKMELPLSAARQQHQSELQSLLATSEQELAAHRALMEKSHSEWEQRLLSSLASKPEWHVLKVAEFKSAGGATSTQLDDQSVLVSGTNPETDTYTVTARTELTDITGFRVEALLDETLPGKGPGRQTMNDRANFVLTEFGVRACPCEDDESEPGRIVSLHSASADHEPAKYEARLALDGDAKTGWSIHTDIHKPHHIRVLTSEPVGFESSTRLVFKLDFQLGWQRAMGRFRISALTGNPSQEAVPDNVLATLKKSAKKRSKKERQLIAKYREEKDGVLTGLQGRIGVLKKKLAAVKPDTTLVMVEQDERRTTHIMKRGEFLNPGAEVQALTPEVLPSPLAGLPKNRLGLARWLVDPQNPLTARVTVNRWWSEIVGQGIVTSLEDFGSQGEPPTHPGLLDWLALELVDHDWSMKELHRVIVMSATYQQSSKITLEGMRRDPQNKLLGRSNRFRLPAETIRDNALRASGLIAAKMHGAPVYPPQPPNIWRHVGRNAPKYIVSEGLDRFRRGVYTVWRRSAPYPGFVNFDAPDRGACVVKRSRTNTPLQALNLLNDEVYTETAFALAERIVRDMPNADLTERVEYAFRLCLSRRPTSEERAVLVEIYVEEHDALTKSPERVKALLANRQKDKALDSVEITTWYRVAEVLLNLDEMITRT